MTTPAHPVGPPVPPRPGLSVVRPTPAADLADQAPRRTGNRARNPTPTAEAPSPVVEQIRAALAERAPVTLGGPVGLPAYPLDALPGVVRDMVAAVAQTVQVDPGMPGTFVLGTLSAATCGRVQVVPRPGWTDDVNLFTLVIAEPSERKGPVERALRAPLDDATAELTERWGAAAREAELTRQVAVRAAATAAEKAAKTTNPEERDKALKEAVDLDKDIAAIDVPAVPRLLAGGDITPEALAEIMHHHGGRMTVMDTEGGFFDRLAGLYSNGVKNLDAVLHGYSGERVEVTRRGTTELIPHAGLALVLMVQPVVVGKLVNDSEMSGRGLLARFLYATPPSLIGRRRTGRDVPPVPAEVAAAYRDRVHALAVELAGWTDPARLRFTDDALDVLDAYEAEVEARMGPGGDLAVTGSWAGKLVGNTVRLAGVLHLAEHGPAGLRRGIDAATTTNAVTLAGYFIAHAHAVLAPRRGVLDDARHVLAYLQRHRLTGFTFADLHRSLSRDRFPTRDATQDAVDVLTAHGWLAELPDLSPPRPGRKPSPRYLTHPTLHPRQEGVA
jgi:replicative DNA helicase